MNRAELLLVDGSLGQRAVLQRLLTSHGFAVTGLACLRQAAATLTVRHFDHAVLDLRLLDRPGLDLVRSLRGRHPRARIAIVTDADSFATVVLALRAGADGLVPKPVDEGELLDVLFDRTPLMPPVPQTPLGLHRTCWEHVTRIYEQCDRNMTQAARRLGMHRRSLQRFLAKRAPQPRADPSMLGDRMLPVHLAGLARQYGLSSDANWLWSNRLTDNFEDRDPGDERRALEARMLGAERS